MSDLPNPSSRLRVALAHSAAFAFFAFLACLATWPLPARVAVGLIGLTGEGLPNNDVAIYLWDFWWFREALFELHRSPFYCDFLGNPGQPTFVFPTLFLAYCALALPLMSVASVETVYNLLVLLVLALNGWAVYFIVVQAAGVWLAAVAAGAFFCTLPVVVAHVTQINILGLCWFGFAVLAGLRLLRTGRTIDAVLLGIAYLVTLLASWYHAIALGMFLVLAAGVAIWRMRSDGVRRLERRLWPIAVVWLLVCAAWWQYSASGHFALWVALLIYLLLILRGSKDSPAMLERVRRLAIGALAVGMFSLPVAIPMWLVSGNQAWLRDTSFSQKTVFSADLASYFLPPTVVERAFPDQPEDDMDLYGVRVRGDANMFPGFVGWVAFVAALVWRISRGRRGGEWLLLGGVFAILSLGPFLKFGGLVRNGISYDDGVFLPAFIFGYLPVLEGLRVSSRFALVAYLCFSVFAGVQAADYLASRASDKARRLAAAFLAVLVCFVVVERLDWPKPAGRVPPTLAFDWLREQPLGRVLIGPIKGNAAEQSVYQNLYSQTRHEKPMWNPYMTRRLEDRDEMIKDNAFLEFLEFPQRRGPAALAQVQPQYMKKEWEQLGVRWLVLDRAMYGKKPVDRIETFARDVLQLDVAYEDADYVVYRKSEEGGGAAGRQPPNAN